MRIVLFLFVAPVLTSCSVAEPAEWGSCRAYLEGKLAAPSTLKVIRTNSTDVPYPDPTYRVVSLEYDAANAFGTPIRGKQSCSFPLRNGRPVVDRYIDHDSEVGNVLSGTGIYDPTANPTGKALEQQADELSQQASEISNDLDRHR